LAVVAALLSCKQRWRERRHSRAAWILSLVLAPAACFAAPPQDIALLDASLTGVSRDAVIHGSLDGAFSGSIPAAPSQYPDAYWLKLKIAAAEAPEANPVLVLHALRLTHVQVFNAGAAIPAATVLAGYRGTLDTVYALPRVEAGGMILYAYVDAHHGERGGVRVQISALDSVLALGAEHARMIALAVGALLSVSLAALLIWFVLADKLFILYASQFFLQALYVAYLSGQGFEWPILSYAAPLTSFAWNVPIGLSGAVGCLFVREIADLRRFSPRVDAIFGWFAAAFVLITIANVAKLIGYGALVTALGNIIFTAAALFTLGVSFLAWRRGNRAAGWFLIAWTLLEGFTVAAAARFLFTKAGDADPMLVYYGLPLSMVAAAVLVALGVADRLRQQRVALSDAERRAQTDSLTGVLNRRSLIERLDAAGMRARARGLSIAVLFIDLDHFKQINDSRGHQAGDACLRAIIEPIHAELRQSDVVGRYGGEEFVVILSSADAAAAYPIAERIRARVAEVRVAGYGEPIQLTCSIGIAASDTQDAWGEFLVTHADAAVYAAKRAGRNRVQMAAAHGAAAF
jgi:two-component system, sensor histidine kinase LadS